MVISINRTLSIFVLLVMSVVLFACKSATNIRPLDESLTTPRPITIMTYNIRIGAGHTKWGRSPYKLKDEISLDLKPVVESIRSIDPDIVGLQEVLGEGQAKELGKALNMNYAYVPHGIDRFGAWWGVAILSKFPIQRVSRHEISSGRGNTRANLIADINIFKKNIVFISIHKDRDQTDGAALRKTIKRLKKISDPVVLIGDLNMRPADDRHDILSDRLVDSAGLVDTKQAKFARERGTYIGEDGDSWGKRIDYILVDKGRFDVLDAGLIEEKHWIASDHLGYYTKVKLK